MCSMFIIHANVVTDNIKIMSLMYLMIKILGTFRISIPENIGIQINCSKKHPTLFNKMKSNKFHFRLRNISDDHESIYINILVFCDNVGNRKI